MQPYSVITLVLFLAIGFICTANSSLEHLYAQEDSTSEDLKQSCPPGTGPDPDGGCSPLPDEAIEEESATEGSGFIDGRIAIVGTTEPTPAGGTTEPTPAGGTTEPTPAGGTTGLPVEPFKNFIPNIDVPDIDVPDVKRIIEEPAKEITGSFENMLGTITPNIPVSTLMLVGIVAVVAIGAGVASFSRHHHGRSSTSHSSQDQTQQDDTEEEQIYEDVQIVTQGGIEEV